MLPADTLVIGDDHIARTETVFAVTFQSIPDHVAQIRDEVRHPADVLRQQSSPGVEQAAAIVAHFVDHHVVRGSLQQVGHLIRDSRKHIANDFQRDDVELHSSKTILRTTAFRQAREGGAGSIAALQNCALSRTALLFDLRTK